MIEQGLTRRVKRILLLVVVPAVMLGVNVPPAWSWISGLRHERLINSQEYKGQFGKWDVIQVPDDQKVNAIHAAVLPTGKILLIAGSGNKEEMFRAGTFKSMVYDPATGQSKVVPTPDDMFFGGHTFLADGKLLVAGGTQRYEKLDGAVTNPAGGLVVKNENPDGAPRTFPIGTEFASPEGMTYRATNPFTVKPAVKVATRRGATVTASETVVFAEATEAGPRMITNQPKQYAIVGLNPAVARNMYALGQKMTLEKQDYQGFENSYEFDPVSETYQRVGDMNFKRWYPTLTGLADGSVLAVSGLDGTGAILNGQNELYDPATKTWTERKDWTRYFPTYPAIFQTEKEGMLFYSGRTRATARPTSVARRACGTCAETPSPPCPACVTPTSSRRRDRRGRARCRTRRSRSSSAAASARVLVRAPASTPSTSRARTRPTCRGRCCPRAPATRTSRRCPTTRC